jgi:hypothetical protein
MGRTRGPSRGGLGGPRIGTPSIIHGGCLARSTSRDAGCGGTCAGIFHDILVMLERMSRRVPGDNHLQGRTRRSEPERTPSGPELTSHLHVPSRHAYCLPWHGHRSSVNASMACLPTPVAVNLDARLRSVNRPRLAHVVASTAAGAPHKGPLIDQEGRRA